MKGPGPFGTDIILPTLAARPPHDYNYGEDRLAEWAASTGNFLIIELAAMSDPTPYYPDQVPIDAYGNGGFRFAGGSHRGSLLLLPSGVYAWDVRSTAEFEPRCFEKILCEARDADFVILGTGVKQIFLDAATIALFDEAGLGLEVMDTGAACRTYNLMMEEKRAMMAALIAVD